MPRKMVSSTSGMGAHCAWSAAQERAVAVGSRSHSQYRTAQGSQQRQIGSGAKRGSMPRPAQRPAAGTVVRERKTPEQARSEASTRVSRLQAALSSLGGGDAAERRALEAASAKAQKQAEEMPVARQIEVTKDFITRAKMRMLVADEKIRLAQAAVQDAMDEKEYDLREVPLAEARLERLLVRHHPHPLCPIWKSRFRGCELKWPRCRLHRCRMWAVTHLKVHSRHQTC